MELAQARQAVQVEVLLTHKLLTPLASAAEKARLTVREVVDAAPLLIESEPVGATVSERAIPCTRAPAERLPAASTAHTRKLMV